MGRRGKGGLRAKPFPPCKCLRDSLSFDMQHDHVLQKLNLDLLTPSPMVVGVGWRIACKIFATMLLHFLIQLLITVMLIYRHWVIMAHSEKLSIIF